mgnify:CR=1 FL=1
MCVCISSHYNTIRPPIPLVTRVRLQRNPPSYMRHAFILKYYLQKKLYFFQQYCYHWVKIALFANINPLPSSQDGWSDYKIEQKGFGYLPWYSLYWKESSGVVDEVQLTVNVSFSITCVGSVANMRFCGGSTINQIMYNLGFKINHAWSKSKIFSFPTWLC